MQSKSVILAGDRLTLRILNPNDTDIYYATAFKHPDPEVIRLTGSTTSPDKGAIAAYVNRTFSDNSRYDFLMFHEDRLVGEVVLNEIDTQVKTAHYRISLFSSRDFSKGYGREATQLLLAFAFSVVKLNRVELEVFDFNPRAKSMYESVGFVTEGRLRETVLLDGNYHDTWIMSILKQEWKERNPHE